MSGNPVSIFISYSRKDEGYMQDLVSHLEPLQRGRLISSWYDGQILPGEEWAPQIKKYLEQAQIILLLISKDFLNSNYCYEIELTKAIERHKARTASVIPVILRSCLWEQVSIGGFRLSDLQALPKDARPVSQWNDPDDALTSVAKGLLDKIQQLQLDQEQTQCTEQQHQAILEQQRQQAALEKQQQLAIETDLKLQAEFRRRQREDTSVQLPHRTPSYGEVKLSRKQFLKWGGVSSIGFITAVGLSQVYKEARSPSENTNPDADNNPFSPENTNPDADNNLFSPENTNPDADNNQILQIDYTRLEEFLKTENWKESDKETLDIMLAIADREEEGWLDTESIENFPCDALKKIDQLWVEASEGKFGFSVQQKIYVEDCGGAPDGQYDEAAWYCFADKVGWRVNDNFLTYSEVTFDSKAPAGHLPGWGSEGDTAVGSSFSRLIKCGA